MPNPNPITTTAQQTRRPAARLACPNCGSAHLSSVEHLTARGRCRAITLDADGDPTFHWTGWTDIDWDSSTTVGVRCEDCLHALREGPLPEILARLARRPVRARRAACVNPIGAGRNRIGVASSSSSNRHPLP